MMDPPIHALKFSEDMIFQILNRHNLIKERKKWGFLQDHEMYQKQRCPMPVFEAVLGLMEHRKERIQASFDELCSIKVFSISDFRFELSLTAIMYFKEGYDHFKFLNYCAFLGGLSVRYVKAGHQDIPSGCAQLLGYFLNFWMYSMVFNPNSDYFELACVAQRVRRNLLVVEEKKGMAKKVAEEGKDTPKVPKEVKDTLNVPEDVKDTQKVPEDVKDTQKVPEDVKDTQKVPEDVKDTQKVSEEVKDTQKKPEKGKDNWKKPKKGDEVSEKNGKEAQKKTEKQKVVEVAKAVHKVDKTKGGKNTPKKKGGEELPETQQKGEVVSKKTPENDGMAEMPKYKRSQKARGGKR